MASAGRPEIYSKELADLVCNRIAKGESLKSICREELMPCFDTVMNWVREKEGFIDQYQRAMDIRADVLFDEIIEIADDARNDWMEKETKNGTITVLDTEHVQRSKLRCDARYWMLARMKPKKYGDKTAVEHSGAIGLGTLIEESLKAKDVAGK